MGGGEWQERKGCKRERWKERIERAERVVGGEGESNRQGGELELEEQLQGRQQRELLPMRPLLLRGGPNPGSLLVDPMVVIVRLTRHGL